MSLRSATTSSHWCTLRWSNGALDQDCSSAGKYSDGSQYPKNLYRFLEKITSLATKKCHKGVPGVGAEKIFTVFMCYVDPDSSMPA
jgi:hypothetical protein